MIDLDLASVLFLTGFVVWVIATALQRRQRLNLSADFNRQLLDRIGSVKDFSDFVQTEAGTKFMRRLTTAEPSTSPQQRILSAVQIGIVLFSLGSGLLGLTRLTTIANRDELTLIGTIALSLGIGFVLSSGVLYRLAYVLGLMHPTDPRG
jgi:hypothetical protein